MTDPEILIPTEELPEGIILSLKNSDRYFNDSKILFGKKRLSSANTLLFLATEEFSKAKFLIDHFKKKNHITKDDYKRYFRDHRLRLGEFEKFFEDNISKMPEWAKDNKNTGKKNQIFKERMMYVDWLQYKWHDPLFLEELVLDDEKDIDKRMYGTFVIHKNMFIHSWNKLINDPIINKIKTIPRIEKPTKLNVIKISRPYLDPKRIAVSVLVNEYKIELNLNSTLKNKSDIRKKLREKLNEKFPDWKIVINLEEKFLR